MATGGTGDILTGMIAGIMAQHPDRAFQAVIAAVFLHGLAGDIGCYGRTPGSGLGEQCLVATDLIRSMPSAFWQARLISANPTVRFGGQGTKLRFRLKPANV
jgi:NAD(P)H-hydrate epimerase